MSLQLTKGKDLDLDNIANKDKKAEMKMPDNSRHKSQYLMVKLKIIPH